MVRILVVPERLQEMSRQMAQAASALRELGGRLGRALDGLDWQVRQRANVEGQVQTARSQANALAEQAEAMARFLSERAAAFQQTDAEEAQDLATLTEPYLRSPAVPTPVPTPTPTPSGQPSFLYWEDVVQFLDDLLKPIDWATGTKKGERQFFRTLEELGRWLNAITGQRGYIKMLRDLGKFLRDAGEGLGTVTTLLEARDWKRYLDGQLTNKEIAEIAITTIISTAATHLGLPLLPAVGVGLLSRPIIDWAISNMPDPNGRWHGLVGQVE